MLRYRIVISLLALLELARLAGRRDRAAIRARLGRLPVPVESAHVWIHGASNGELASARPVILALAQRHRLLVTANTATGVALVRGWRMQGVCAHLAPLDLPGPTRRVLRDWRVQAHVTLESEIWPMRIARLRGPVIVLGGRLTERSAKSWSRFSGLARKTLKKVAFLSAQDRDSRDRFRQLGLPEAAAGPVVDLKAFYRPRTETPPRALTEVFRRDTTWLAASTHPGEEEVVLEAHRIARKSRPGLRLILAPRHPRRAEEILAQVSRFGLTAARRSTGDAPGQHSVYLADTMGEMHLWYQLAGIVFVAGSLTDRGGHTPYEPAAYDAALIHGPDTRNFSAAYNRLRNAGAGIEAGDAPSLARAVLRLTDPARRRTQAHAAREALKQDSGLHELLSKIHEILD